MRISDWSSDVCSSDLRGAINDWTRSFASGLLLVIVGAFALAQPGVTEFLGSRFTGMILIAGGAGAAATAFPTTGSQCSWLDALFGSLCSLLGSPVLVEPFRETVPLVWMVTILQTGRASCGGGVCQLD